MVVLAMKAPVVMMTAAVKPLDPETGTGIGRIAIGIGIIGVAEAQTEPHKRAAMMPPVMAMVISVVDLDDAGSGRSLVAALRQDLAPGPVHRHSNHFARLVTPTREAAEFMRFHRCHAQKHIAGEFNACFII